jgi:hypothetical protein
MVAKSKKSQYNLANSSVKKKGRKKGYRNGSKKKKNNNIKVAGGGTYSSLFKKLHKQSSTPVRSSSSRPSSSRLGSSLQRSRTLEQLSSETYIRSLEEASETASQIAKEAANHALTTIQQLEAAATVRAAARESATSSELKTAKKEKVVDKLRAIQVTNESLEASELETAALQHLLKAKLMSRQVETPRGAFSRGTFSNRQSPSTGMTSGMPDIVEGKKKKKKKSTKKKRQ